MSDEFELMRQILKTLNQKGLLEHILIVGSWCLHFYKHHYKDSKAIKRLRTTDIDLDVNFLRKRKLEPVNIPDLLKPLGFDLEFHGDGSINLSLRHPVINKLEFIIPEVGRGYEGPVKIPAFGITAQPLRFIDLLEDEIITVDYDGLEVKVPHPARFALHKLIVSQKRRTRKMDKVGKSDKDIQQGVEVLNMLIQTGKDQEVLKVFSSLNKNRKRDIKQALNSMKTQDETIFTASDLWKTIRGEI